MTSKQKRKEFECYHRHWSQICPSTFQLPEQRLETIEPLPNIAFNRSFCWQHPKLQKAVSICVCNSAVHEVSEIGTVM